MPAKAQAGNFDVQVASMKVTAHVFTALSHPVFVMCGYYDFPSAPSDTEKVFDETREGSVRDVHGTLLTEKKLAKDGYPGRRFRLTAKNAFLDEEMFLVGHRFYFIKISTSTPTPSTNITKVFDSFHFAVSQ